MLRDTLIEKDDDTNEDTLVAVKSAALVDRLDAKLPEAETETLERRLGDSKGRTEAPTKTHCDPLYGMPFVSKILLTICKPLHYIYKTFCFMNKTS